MNEWFKSNGVQIAIYLVTIGYMYANFDTRLAFAERELLNATTFNTTVVSRLAIVETELKANTRMIEQVYGYIKATNQAAESKNKQ